MAPIRIAVNGAAGRMGRRMVALIATRGDCELVCALERPDHPAIGQDVGMLAGGRPLGVKVGVALHGKPHVLVDFSTPAACVARAAECAQQGVAMLVATTGLSEDQRGYLRRDVASAVPLLVSSNMSLGVNVLFRIAADVARALGTRYDIEIVEAHHRHKKDAPSGTARTLVERICSALAWDPLQVTVYGRQGDTGERPVQQIGVHAVRCGDVAGEHTVIFAAQGERLELTHRASSPDVFAEGAIRAAVFLAGKPPGLYTMDDVLAG